MPEERKPTPADEAPQVTPDDPTASNHRETGRDFAGGYGGSGFAGEDGKAGGKTPDAPAKKD